MKRLAMVVLLIGSACDSSGVSSKKDAEAAYLGLDQHIDKAIQLGFDGFNSASSANISPQMTTGLVTGTLTVTGQVDQGASSNKEMRLFEQLVTYSDDTKHTYDTAVAALPALTMSLKKIPTGTMTGTLIGEFAMSGDIDGKVTLNLTLAADLQATASDATKVERKPGTMTVVGTAVSPAGTYAVNLTR